MGGCDQHMPWIDLTRVHKCKHEVIFVYFYSGYASVSYLCENCLHSGVSFLTKVEQICRIFLVIAFRGGMHDDTYCIDTVIPRCAARAGVHPDTHHSVNDARFEPWETPVALNYLPIQ